MPGTVPGQMRKLRQRGVRGRAPDHTLVGVKAWDQDLSLRVPHSLPWSLLYCSVRVGASWVVFVFQRLSVSQIFSYSPPVRYNCQAHLTDGDTEAPRGDTSRPTGWHPLVCPPVKAPALTHPPP